MKVITANMIDSLSSVQSRKFQGLLPELIKKLLIHSVPKLSSLRIPDNDDIWAPGFDGIVECSETTLYVNSGKSVWEFGSVDDTLKKINADYEKRTENSLGLDKKNTSYYAVIPRIWAFDSKGYYITKWESEKTEWKSVRLYDASVLCDWINSTPIVAAWLIEQIFDDTKIDFSTVDEAWKMFSKTTSPEFSNNLFTNGRNREIQDLLHYINENNIIRVKSRSSLDSFGFCLSALQSSTELRNSVIVVYSRDTYNRLSKICKGKCFLLKSMDIDIFSDENKSIICYSNEAVSVEPDICLSSLRKQEYLDAIKVMGINDGDLEDFYFHTHGELFALIRRIPGYSNIIKPNWCDNPNVKILFPLLFLRTININNFTDRKICEVFTGESFDVTISKYNDFCKFEDSPIKHIECIYSITSYEETWNVLIPDVNESEIDILTDVVLHILDICSKKEANDYNITSSKAKVCLQNLTLNYLYYSYSYSDSYKLNNYISSILTRLWESKELLSVLNIFAEAAPEIVMDILEEDYKSINSNIMRIFADGGYGSNYTDILHSIDMLVLNKSTKIRACNLLYRLSQIETKYFWSNTPKESLLNALWLCNNEGELTLDEKKSLSLKYLNDTDIGTALIFELLNKNSSYRGVRIGSKKPQKKPVKYKEYFSTVFEISNALIKKIIQVSDVAYISKIIDNYWCIPHTVMQLLLNSLNEIKFNTIDKIAIYYKIQYKIYLNNISGNSEHLDYIILFEEFIKDIGWNVEKMIVFYDNYYACPLISNSPLNSEKVDYLENEKYVLGYRIEALNELYSKHNVSILDTLFAIMSDDTNWGYILSKSSFITEIDVIINIAISANKYKILSGFLNELEPEIAYSRINLLMPEQIKIILPYINNVQLSDYIENDELKSIFWSTKFMCNYSEYEYRNLLKYNPEGLLKYYIFIDRKNMIDNIDKIIQLLNTLLNRKKSNNSALTNERHLIESFFNEMDNKMYYSDEYATLCLKLFKFNSHHRFFECIKKYYFFHPEKICQIINDFTDEYVNEYELSLYYELPNHACDNFNKLNSFVKCIINNSKDDKMDLAYKFIGRLLAKEMYEDRCENSNILQLIEIYSNDYIDFGVIHSYDSIELVKTIGDGSRKRKKYDFLNQKAESIEIDFPHTANLLRRIAKVYLSESKTEYIISEFGLTVL